MALGHRDFLRRLEEFERVPSKDQRGSLENIFRVSLDRALLSISQVALLTDLFAVCSVRYPVLGLSAGCFEGEGLGHRRPPEEA